MSKGVKQLKDATENVSKNILQICLNCDLKWSKLFYTYLN